MLQFLSFTHEWERDFWGNEEEAEQKSAWEMTLKYVFKTIMWTEIIKYDYSFIVLLLLSSVKKRTPKIAAGARVHIQLTCKTRNEITWSQYAAHNNVRKGCSWQHLSTWNNACISPKHYCQRTQSRWSCSLQ